MAGITNQNQEDIFNQTVFLAAAKLPIRYLDLFLLTLSMKVTDYLPLIEKMRKKISTQTMRFLYYAGRMQLIKLVITSLTNFWMAAFRLSNSCVK